MLPRIFSANIERGDSVPDVGSGLLGLGGGRMSKEKKSLTQRGGGALSRSGEEEPKRTGPSFVRASWGYPGRPLTYLQALCYG